MTPDQPKDSYPNVTVSLEIGWPKCKAIASTTLEDGKTIAQVGEESSKHYGTELAGKMAKVQAVARLKAAIQVYRVQSVKESATPKIITEA